MICRLRGDGFKFAIGAGFGTGFSANRSMIVVFQERMMTRLKWLAATLLSGVLIAAPLAAQAADYALRRHHHRHHRHIVIRQHIPWFSYLHNYGPGPLPGTWAYYDGPTSVRCKQSAAAYRGQDGRRHPCN
jgi:hypothetical protein